MSTPSPTGANHYDSASQRGVLAALNKDPIALTLQELEEACLVRSGQFDGGLVAGVGHCSLPLARVAL